MESESDLTLNDPEIYFEDAINELKAKWFKLRERSLSDYECARCILQPHDLEDYDTGDYCDEAAALIWLSSMIKEWKTSGNF